VNPIDLFRLGSSAGATVTAFTVMFDLALAFVLGQAIAFMYTLTHRGMSYSRNMVHSVVLLCMIVTAVMSVVGDSIARAFGLVGALAIIRFRTVVRDARDTTYIFLALAVGIAIGAQHYAVAIVGTLFIGLVGIQLNWTGFGTRRVDAGVLRVRSRADSQDIEQAVGAWCRSHQLLTLREGGGGENEYSFEIRLYHPEERENLVTAVRGVPGTSSVQVAIEEGTEEW
jgi:uncharacterized membrane protein YhiD involved in acid resistance